MYASVQKRDIPLSWLFRCGARAGSLVIVISWFVLVVLEFIKNGAPVPLSYYQAALLAIVFAGYAAGWRHELLGGAMTVLGTIGFMVLNYSVLHVSVTSGAAWFAAPGVFYLIAHYLDDRRSKLDASQP